MHQVYNDEYLMHHGVKGMHWGIRRYQNSDGSLTPMGKKRYGVFSEKEQKKLTKALKKNKYDSVQIGSDALYKHSEELKKGYAKAAKQASDEIDRITKELNDHYEQLEKEARPEAIDFLKKYENNHNPSETDIQEVVEQIVYEGPRDSKRDILWDKLHAAEEKQEKALKEYAYSLLGQYSNEKTRSGNTVGDALVTQLKYNSQSGALPEPASTSVKQLIGGAAGLVAVGTLFSIAENALRKRG